MLEVQPRHEPELLEALENIGAYRILEGPTAWTYWRHGRPLGCGGIFNGIAWAFLGPDLRHDMARITRFVRNMLALYPGKVTAEIDEEFPSAVRWAKLLGFRRQSPGWWVHDRL